MFTSQSQGIWKFIIEWLSLHELVHLLLRPNVEGDVRNNKVVVRVDVWTTWFVNQAPITLQCVMLNKLLCITVDEVKIDIAECKPGSKAVEIRTKHLWDSNQSPSQNDPQNMVAQLIKKAPGPCPVCHRRRRSCAQHPRRQWRCDRPGNFVYWQPSSPTLV